MLPTKEINGITYELSSQTTSEVFAKSMVKLREQRGYTNPQMLRDDVGWYTVWIKQSEVKRDRDE